MTSARTATEERAARLGATIRRLAGQGMGDRKIGMLLRLPSSGVCRVRWLLGIPGGGERAPKPQPREPEYVVPVAEPHDDADNLAAATERLEQLLAIPPADRNKFWKAMVAVARRQIREWSGAPPVGKLSQSARAKRAGKASAASCPVRVSAFAREGADGSFFGGEMSVGRKIVRRKGA